MKQQNTKLSILSNLFWKLMERGGTQGIQFIIQIVLARLLGPKEYGIVALVMIFILISNVFVQRGFNTALIQKKNADEIDLSSVFYLNLLVAVFLYFILYMTAPLIADFYNESQLISILRVLSFILFFGAINSIQNAVISRKMQFKKLFFSSLGAILVSGIVSISLAYAGFGVWALVVQQVTNQFLVTIFLWFIVKWRPSLIFSFERVKGLFSYGWKLLVSSLIDTLYMDLRSLIIGKIYSPTMLGYYNRGKQFPSLIVTNINGSIQSVMLPVLASQQENRQRVKEIVRRSVVTSSFIIFPMMFGLAAIAEPLVKIILTDKWLPCVPFLQIYCVVYAIYPIHTANLQAINALGRSDIFLKLEIIKKIVGLAILGVTLSYGVYEIALGGILSGFISSIVNTYPNKGLLNYGYKQQLGDIMPSLVLSIVMWAVVYSIQFLRMTVWPTLITQVFIGFILYVGLAKVFKLECLNYLVMTVKQMVANNKSNYEQI